MHPLQHREKERRARDDAPVVDNSRLWDGNGTARISLYRMRAEGRCDAEPICETHLAVRRY